MQISRAAVIVLHMAAMVQGGEVKISPMLILHGTADTTTPLSGSQRFAEKLEEVGVEHQLVIVEGAPHSFDLQPKQRDLRELVVGFFDKHLRREKQ